MARTQSGSTWRRSYRAFSVLEGNIEVLSMEMGGKACITSFPAADRREMLASFPESVVQDFEKAVWAFRVRAQALERYLAEREAIDRSRKRLVRRFAAALKEIEDAPSLIKDDMKPLAELMTFWRSAFGGKPGRPQEHPRRQLHVDVGRALVRGGFELTTARNGKLAVALQSVVPIVDPAVSVMDPLPICKYVCRVVGAEVRQRKRRRARLAKAVSSPSSRRCSNPRKT
jgi:hypothetical protein